MSEEEISAMLDNTSLSLHTFSVQGVRYMHDEAAEMLSNFILSSSFLIDLDLPGNGLTARGALHVAKALSQVHVSVVRNFGFSVYGDDVTDFVELLQGDYSQFVDMDDALHDFEFRELGDDGVEDLVEFVRYDSILDKLDLSGNSISDKGAELLGDALHDNSTVKFLYLSKNNNGDTGAEALAQALHSNTKLEKLFLDHNNIHDHGVKALAQALCHNYSLKTLHLGENPGISEQALHCLIRALTVNTSITRTSSSDGLVLDRVQCQNYAYKCPDYSKVEHKINFI